MRVAQTHLQLFNQLRAEGRGLDELEPLHRAYELLAELYSGHYQADGKPFVCHGVGVASILGWLGMPAEMLTVGMLHNVYGNADFGDGRQGAATRSRRDVVRQVVGARVETLVFRFRSLRITGRSIDGFMARLEELDRDDRALLVVDLADLLEKNTDLGALYFGDGRWVLEQLEGFGVKAVELARRLEQPALAAALESAFTEVRQAATGFPPELRASGGRKYMQLVVPHSCRRRMRARLGATTQRLRGRARRMRRSRGPSGGAAPART
jgi:hypothetical protein